MLDGALRRYYFGGEEEFHKGKIVNFIDFVSMSLFFSSELREKKKNSLRMYYVTPYNYFCK